MNIGFLGCGNMANAILKGILAKDKFEKDKIYAYDINTNSTNRLADNYGINIVDKVSNLFRDCDIIILAIKPNILLEILPSIKPLINSDHLLISIAAGISLSSISSIIGEDKDVIRVMPNINATVLESMSCICYNSDIDINKVKVCSNIFECIGKVIYVEEKYLPVYTAISACSPAFVFLFIDSIAKAAQKSGIDKQTAIKVVAQATFGSAKLLLETDSHPQSLIDMVCSPGGTTIEGICSLEESAFTSTLIKAVDATIQKDKKLNNND